MMSQTKAQILVVDDEENILNTMAICFDALGFETILCRNSAEVSELVSANDFALAFVDLRMAPLDGMDVLALLNKQAPHITVTIITAHGSIETAIEAIKNGAYDYLQKPFELKELQLFTQRAMAHHQLSSEVRELRQIVAANKVEAGEFITQNKATLAIIDLANRVADSQLSIIIEGESGTGKELMAETIHRNSARASKPLVKVNCAAIPESLLESELFGHVKGAFTGALKDRKGRFELAHGGTIFLDEIAELSAALQAKLLRVLQQKEFERVGESEPQKVDVRIIAATNKNLDEAIKEGSFRDDLFYRLNGVRLKMLPLRERPEDILLLIDHFLNRYAPESGTKVTDRALRALRSYRWSGNVRELANVIQRAIVLSRNRKIDLEQLPEELQPTGTAQESLLSLEEMEKLHIKRVLQQARDYDHAASLLGIDPATLWRKRKKYGI